MMSIWGRKYEPEMLPLSRFKGDEAKQKVFLPSFAVVRNPLSRVVSAWRDKFGPNTKNDSMGEKQNFWVSISIFAY